MSDPGAARPTIRKNGRTLTLMNAYTEQPRPQFPVSWKTFVSGVMSEFARAKARAAGAPEKYAYLFWDSTVF